MSVSDRDLAALRDVLSFGREAEQLVARGKPAYDGDVMLQRAAQMICLNLGEATKRLSIEVREAHPDIRFKMMVATRDKVAHGYQIVDPQVIWDTITTAIPEDIARVDRLFGDLSAARRLDGRERRR